MKCQCGCGAEVSSNWNYKTNRSVRFIYNHSPRHGPKAIINDRAFLFKLYWDDLMSSIEIAKQLKIDDVTVRVALARLKIPTRSRSNACRLGLMGGRYLNGGYWATYINRKLKVEHLQILEKILGRRLTKKEAPHHKDFCPLNNHPLNLEVISRSIHVHIHKSKFPERIPMYEVYMRMAEQIALRSTCVRMKTGSIIVSGDLTKVYSVGFNGTVRGWVNSCNGIEGKCGCIHSEENALLKVGVEDPNKILFCTSASCMSCAKKIIQAGFSDVFYRNNYRDKKPITFLHYHGIRTCKYDKYKDKNWSD